MIEYGPRNHGIRARRLSTAFARLRAFLERCTDRREAVFGFGGPGTVTMTFDQIASELAALDAAAPMAALNGYVWSLACSLRDPATSDLLPDSGASRIAWLAHGGRLSVDLYLVLPFEPEGDEFTRFALAVKETTGVRLSSRKIRALRGR